MKLLTGLFMAAKKRLMTTDNGAESFKTALDEIIAKKDALSPEEIGSRIDALKKLTDNLPESDGKSQLLRYLEDFREVKSQDANVAAEAASAVAEQFEKLYAEALHDAPEVTPKTGDTPPAQEPKKDDPPPASGGTDDPAKKAAEETKAPDNGKETKDEEPAKVPTLEEIYEYVKKRMDEDAAKKDGGEGGGVSGDEKKTATTDNAPKIPVTIGGETKPNEGSLGALFDMAKGRKAK